MSLSTSTTQKLMREFRSLTTSPPEGIRIHINDDNITHIHADIDGPVGTPFQGNNKGNHVGRHGFVTHIRI